MTFHRWNVPIWHMFLFVGKVSNQLTLLNVKALMNSGVIEINGCSLFILVIKYINDVMVITMHICWY